MNRGIPKAGEIYEDKDGSGSTLEILRVCDNCIEFEIKVFYSDGTSTMGTSMMDYDGDFRSYWRNTKLKETPLWKVLNR